VHLIKRTTVQPLDEKLLLDVDKCRSHVMLKAFHAARNRLAPWGTNLSFTINSIGKNNHIITHLHQTNFSEYLW
jgi:hypothetical protein